MPINTETIIRRWFSDETDLKVLNGIVHHRTDKEIARENNVRIDRVSNYRSKLKKKGLLTAGLYSINHAKLGLVKLLDFPKERPPTDDVFLIRLAQISAPFGYLRMRLLPPALVEEGYQLGANIDVMNEFTVPLVVEDFMTRFEDILGQEEPHFYERKNKKKDNRIDLLSIYICKEIEKENYGARVLAKAISQQIGEEELGVQPSISNISRRLKELRNSDVICRSNPLNLVPLRPYYAIDAALVKKNENFDRIIAALARLNVLIRINDILNVPDTAYISLQYYFSQKWEVLRILEKYVKEFTFLDHTPFQIRRTIPYEYFRDVLSKEK